VRVVGYASVYEIRGGVKVSNEETAGRVCNKREGYDMNQSSRSEVEWKQAVRALPKDECAGQRRVMHHSSR
jgi:hypothetical protein